jgi:hypothetical protein
VRRRVFFEEVPKLFPRANVRLWEGYEETLFGMRRPVTYGNFWTVRRYVGGNPPQSAIADARLHRELDGVLSHAKYPDAGPIDRLEEFTEGNVEFASALLHFNNPAYPILDDATVRGLNQLEILISFNPKMQDDTVDTYQAVIDAIQELKDAIPYQCVPEKNYYLTRIIQESLWQLGQEPPQGVGMRKAPSRRSVPHSA